MAHIRDNTTAAALKAQDVYTDLATLLTAEGWVQQGSSIAGPSATWYIWQNPAANSGLSKAFHVAIGTQADGSKLRFRMFEDWTGVGNKVNRPAPQGNPTTVSAGGGLYKDSYDLAISGASSNGYPIPWTPGTGSFARAGGDYSVGAWDNAGSKSDANLTTPLNNAPHDFHFLSEFVSEFVLNTADGTACEYIAHVNTKALYLCTRRVQANLNEGIFAGAYEPVHVLDPMPIGIFRLQQNLHYGDGTSLPWSGSFTRFWGHDGAVESSQGAWDVEGSAASYIGGKVTSLSTTFGKLSTNWQSLTESAMSNEFDALAKGVIMSRAAFTGGYQSAFLSASGLRGALYGPMVGYEANTAGSPALNFGDEVTINGVDHYFVGCISTYGLDDGQSNPQTSDKDPFFLPKT